MHNLLECVVDHSLQVSVLETSLLGLGERGAESEGNDNIVRVLLLAGSKVRSDVFFSSCTASAYMAARPLFPGVICLITEEMRSTAIVLTWEM